MNEQTKKDTLIAIGEALIDFIPSEKGCLFSQVKSFSPKCGGAPANVCGAFTRLGGKSKLITQLGNDPFGDKLIEEFEKFNIGTDYISRTDKANTALAFVSLQKDGNRTFSFYRNPSADMLYDPENIKEEWFENAFALHFCSVALVDSPMKEAHKKAVTYAKKHGAIISFDPNLRLMLWEDHDALKKTVREFCRVSDIIKISDEELEFITGKSDIKEAIKADFLCNSRLIIYTCGKNGAYCFTKKSEAYSKCEDVTAVDTTGAGDAFIGSFLRSLYCDGKNVELLGSLTNEELRKYADNSNRYCEKSIQKYGAIASYPTKF